MTQNSNNSSFSSENKNIARLTLRSPLTGILNTFETNAYSQEEFDRRWFAYEKGFLSPDEAFPKLSTNFKNFIITGIPEFEWEMYKEFGNNTIVGMDRYFI